MFDGLLQRLTCLGLLQAAALGAAGPGVAIEPAHASPEELSPHQALDRAFDNLYDADFVQVLRITTRSPTGRELTQRLQITRKQRGGPGRALVRFLDPPDLRGTSLLVFQREDRHDDVFLYLPAFERTRRVSSAQRSDSFFGTDFTYEDLEPKRAGDYVVESLGSTEAESGARLKLLAARPTTEDLSQYDRVVYAIDTSTDVILWSEHFREGSLLKRLVVDPHAVRRISDRHVPFRATMSSVKGTRTLLEIESYDVRRTIPETLFTVTNLSLGDSERDRIRSSDSLHERRPARPNP